MIMSDQALHGTYRCPVCGHRDTAEVVADGRARTVICTYCDATLEVSAPSAAAVHFTAQVANLELRS
jgi:transcription elongation factor Elf1